MAVRVGVHQEYHRQTGVGVAVTVIVGVRVDVSVGVGETVGVRVLVGVLVQPQVARGGPDDRRRSSARRRSRPAPGWCWNTRGSPGPAPGRHGNAGRCPKSNSRSRSEPGWSVGPAPRRRWHARAQRARCSRPRGNDDAGGGPERSRGGFVPVTVFPPTNRTGAASDAGLGRSRRARRWPDAGQDVHRRQSVIGRAAVGR